MHLHTQTSLWTTLKENASTYSSRHFHLYTSGFIDNVFFIWTGSQADLDNVLNKLNTKHPSMKSEYKISKEVI